MRSSKRHLGPALTALVLVVALSASVALGAAGCGAPTPAMKVRIAIYPGEMSAPIAVAEAEGYFQSNGLDVTQVESQTGAAAVQTLLAGDADVATAADYVFASASFSEPSLRLLASIDRVKTIWLITTTSSGISTAAGLKGRRVGVSPGTLGAYALGSSLKREGLTIGDVTVVDLAPEEMSRALAAGTVEAVVIWDPVAYQLKEMLGEEAVTWSALGDQHFHFTAISTEEVLKRAPGMSERLMRSLVDAVDFIRKNPRDARRAVSMAYGLSMPYLDYAWPNNFYEISLTNCLMLQLDLEATWYVESGFAGGTPAPDYLERIDFTGLQRADPEAVEVAH